MPSPAAPILTASSGFFQSAAIGTICGFDEHIGSLSPFCFAIQLEPSENEAVFKQVFTSSSESGSL